MPTHFRAELGVAEHALARHDAGLEDRLIVIDVVQERVQRLHALAQPAVEHLPLVRGNDARNDVERNQSLGAGILAVHRERDADAMKRALGLVALLGDPGRRRPVEPAGECPVMRPDTAVGSPHFIVWGAGHGEICGGVG